MLTFFENSGGRYRFGKFHNSKNLETQAFTLGFGLHFTDFYTLFWKNNVCFLIFWESCEALQVWQIPPLRKHWNASVYDRFCIYLAFTLRFILHFIDFDTLFLKINVCFLISENSGRHYRFGKFHHSENLETQAFTIGFHHHHKK